MSLYDYRIAEEIFKKDYPFYSLIMAAIRQADTTNEIRLRMAFPEVFEEVEKRYHARGGKLKGD